MVFTSFGTRIISFLYKDYYVTFFNVIAAHISSSALTPRQRSGRDLIGGTREHEGDQAALFKVSSRFFMLPTVDVITPATWLLIELSARTSDVLPLACDSRLLYASRSSVSQSVCLSVSLSVVCLSVGLLVCFVEAYLDGLVGR